MKPAARIAAAIDVLDAVIAGEAAEKVLTSWARRNRYAGSGDRATVRDHVFDALRRRRSYGWLGGADSGRGLMLGALRALGSDPAEFFTGEKYAPAQLTVSERCTRELSTAPRAVRLDFPDWMIPELTTSMGHDLEAVALVMQHRAPVFLRVNTARVDRAEAARRLAADGIVTKPVNLSHTALEITDGPRKLRHSDAYRDGLVEPQDVASQAVVDFLPKASRILDYCAGGGGKSLALAARRGCKVYAHDVDPVRMRDLPVRAARADADVAPLDAAGVKRAAPFDLVLCDAPCSGSGSWRRSPDAKWRLDQDRLTELMRLQAGILAQASNLVSAGGYLAFATCSLLHCENRDNTAKFLAAHTCWKLVTEHSFSPLDGGDGFYVAVLTRIDQHA